jgi:hypothetical protein
MILRSQCVNCKHKINAQGERYPRGTCAAFPHGIPKEIVFSQFDHRYRYPGDNGIGWEPDEAGDTHVNGPLVAAPKP